MTYKTFLLITLCIILVLAGCNQPSMPDETAASAPTDTSATTKAADMATPEPKETTAGSLQTVFQGDCPYEEQYEIWDISTEVFSQDILEELGANGMTGTDAEIAQQIFDWQLNNMDYAGPDSQYSDIGYGARWNEMIPGIYPASKRIEHKNEQGKIYGICFDYSAIYCAIAQAYGLECRTTIYTYDAFESIYGCLPLEVVESELNRGMGREEYEKLNVVLQENGINLTYDQVYRAVSGISLIDGHVQGSHSRAEVYLDGEWVPMDVVHFINRPANPEDDDAKNYTVANWDGIYNPIRLYAPAAQDSSMPGSPVDYDALVEYLSFGPQVMYEGITDDYGNENRADDFTSFVTGDAYLPYVSGAQGLADFMHIDIHIAEDEEYEELMSDFYEGTGRPFNIIADFLIYDDGEMDAERYVYLYNGLTGDNMTVDEFYEYVE
ncbi:MAG: transglutaminase domain-containing protein [Eubacteriales bacterium]